ncbi:MAG: hypothetical protein EA377_06155 [Phycisphaerales bacterium]|nr:MAG: hypothetical protein EA377_06155 [Phycisphaerales bacterium]
MMINVVQTSGSRHQRGKPTSRRGAAAVAMVVLMLLMALILVGMVLAGARQQEVGLSRVEAARAFYAAEAGLNVAARELVLDEDVDDNGQVGSIAIMTMPGSSNTTTMVDVERNGNTAVLTAYGESGRANRRSVMTVNLPPPGSGSGWPGLAAAYFALPSSPNQISDVDWEAVPDAVAAARRIDWPNVSNSTRFWVDGPSADFAARFAGQLRIDEAGLWTFELESNDGARLWIDGEEVVDNDGVHGMQASGGTVELEAGWHPFEIRYFSRSSDHGLIARWTGPGVPAMSSIPPENLAHTSADLHQPIPRLAVKETMFLWGEGSGEHHFVDGYDSSQGAYGEGATLDVFVATNSTDSQAVQMTASTIYGSLGIGPGGDPDHVVATSQYAQITGTIAPMSSRITVPRLVVPNDVPASSGHVAHWSGTHTYSEDFRYSTWTIGNDSVVNVTQPIVGFVDAGFTVQDDARLNILPGASLTLYVEGAVNLYSTAEVNTNTHEPERVRLFMTGSNQQMLMTDRTRFVGHIVNPTGALEMRGDGPMPHSQLFGSFFGRHMETSDRIRIHLDYKSVLIEPGSGGQEVTLTDWTEVSP